MQIKKGILIGVVALLIAGIFLYVRTENDKKTIEEETVPIAESTQIETPRETGLAHATHEQEEKLSRIYGVTFEAPTEPPASQVFLFGENGVLIILDFEGGGGTYAQQDCRYKIDETLTELTIYYQNGERETYPFAIKKNSIVVNGLEYKKSDKKYYD